MGPSPPAPPAPQAAAGEPAAAPLRTIGLGVWSAYVNLAVTCLTQLAIVPLLLHHLGTETYGLYVALNAVVGYFGLLAFGSALTVPRYVAEYATRGEREALARFVSTYLVAHLAVAAAGLVAGWAIAPIVRAVLKAPPALRATVEPAWRLVLAAWAVGFSTGLFQSVLVGLGRVHLANVAAGGRTLLNLSIIAVILWTDGDLERLLLGLLAGALVSNLAVFVLVRRARPGLRLSPRLARWETFRQTSRPAAYAFLMQVSAVVVLGTDTVVIGAFLGVGAVAPYAVAFQIFALALAVVWSGGDALFPFFTAWRAQGDAERLRCAFLLSTKYAVAGGALAAVLYASFARTAIEWWVGPGLYVGTPVVWVFCALLLMAMPIHTAALVLAALGRHRAPALGGTVEALLNVVLSIVLVRRLGVLGVALGTAIAGGLTNAWIAPRAACRELGVPIAGYLRGVLAPSLVPAAVAGGAALLLSGPARASPVEAAGAAAAVAAAFAATFWFLGTDAGERRSVRRLLLGRASCP